MTSQPKVSAIIIVLDGERFIAEAIDSVRAQSFPEWELLVVDDGSTDGTIPIVERFAEADTRIRLLRHPDGGNHGMSATRNLGIDAARGTYIGFLDSDDRWLPHKLAEQVGILDAEPQTGMVYGRTRIWHSWQPGTEQGDYFYDLGVDPDRTYDPPRLLYNLLPNRAQTPTTCNALMRRDAVVAVGGFDPTFRAMFEDQLFFAKLMARFPVHVSGRCWALYRQHEDASSAREADVEEIARAQVRYLAALSRHLRARKRFSRERLAVMRQVLIVRARGARLRLKRIARR